MGTEYRAGAKEGIGLVLTKNQGKRSRGFADSDEPARGSSGLHSPNISHLKSCQALYFRAGHTILC